MGEVGVRGRQQDQPVEQDLQRHPLPTGLHRDPGGPEARRGQLPDQGVGQLAGPLARGELSVCEERGIAFLPWSPLGGISRAAEAPGRHDPVREAAEAHGVSPQQVALAWLLSLSPVVIPIPGASRPESVEDSVRAADLQLSPAQLEAIGAVAAAA